MKDYRELARKRAVALKYDPNEGNAPTIVAAGKGLVADNIIKKAQENDVAIHEDATLAETLSTLELGSEIPEALYEVVAEVILFIAEIDEKKRLMSL